MHQFFKSTFFNFEFIRILSAAPFEGAEIAECLVACGEIRDGDPESWHRAWYKQAEKVLALANEAERNGDRVSARRNFLRASNYLRASAYMFLDLDRERVEPRISKASHLAQDTFEKGAKLIDGASFHAFDIPFESGSVLPAHLFVPASCPRGDGVMQSPGMCPVLLNLGGADSCKEELYFMYAATGPQLGYAVLTFDGPGQGMLLRGQPGKVLLASRPDWENVVAYVIDHLEKFSGSNPQLNLDLSRISVAGSSMGGYYALRAAADPRVQACVAIDPFHDMYDFAVAHVGVVFGGILQAWSRGWIPTMVVNGMMGIAMSLDFRTYWEVGIVQWFMAASTPTKALLQMRRYSFKQPDGSNFLAKIKCPVLISSAGQSLYLKLGTDAKLIYDGLDQLVEQKKIVWSATSPEDGGLQAKMGAVVLAAQKTFDFLNRFSPNHHETS